MKSQHFSHFCFCLFLFRPHLLFPDDVDKHLLSAQFSPFFWSFRRSSVEGKSIVTKHEIGDLVKSSREKAHSNIINAINCVWGEKKAEIKEKRVEHGKVQSASGRKARTKGNLFKIKDFSFLLLFFVPSTSPSTLWQFFSSNFDVPNSQYIHEWLPYPHRLYQPRTLDNSWKLPIKTKKILWRAANTHRRLWHRMEGIKRYQRLVCQSLTRGIFNFWSFLPCLLSMLLGIHIQTCTAEFPTDIYCCGKFHMFFLLSSLLCGIELIDIQSMCWSWTQFSLQSRREGAHHHSLDGKRRDKTRETFDWKNGRERTIFLELVNSKV